MSSAKLAEVAVPYAMLALYDDKVDITAENIEKLLGAAGIEIEPIWATVFAKAFEGKDLGDFLTNITAGVGSAPAAAAAPAAAGASASAAAPAAKKEKPVEKEESDEEMGFGLFD